MNQLYVLGIDMGATNTAFGVVDARGNILFRDQISTTGYATGEEYVQVLGSAINALISKNNLQRKIKGIGMGAPNGNMHEGTIEKAANIPWTKTVVVPLAKMITEITGLNCKLTNDANAAALGEMSYGAARGMKDFIVITLGTGLGSGIVSNGQLVVGYDGFAGELGHSILVRNNGRPCGCGRFGCLETYASATGVARTAREFLEIRQEDSLLRKITCRPITSKDVFLAAEEGDRLAIEIFDFTARMLGLALCDFITFSGPQAIILFGGLAHADKYLLEPLRKVIDENVLSIYKGKTQLLVSGLKGAEAAILGASALAWE
ncbi:MAG: ROK family protein [Dysgonamonadaceae bacterium]|jgi:glucokinase|nr:ROK family protein [Dysgonamonadaceae bacterium]